MLEKITAQAPLFLLAAVRCFALIMTLPLLSARTVPRAAKIALAGYMAFLVLPSAYSAGWESFSFAQGAFSLDYVLLLAGESLIGVLTGFYISIIFGAFSSAGQFFTFQMGLSAAQSYDTMAQVENPLMGQFLNLAAMLLFMQTKGFQTLFLGGVLRSFETFNAFSFIAAGEHITRFLLSSLTDLFFDAFMISLPLVGIFFLISITMGILSKAAPQMNLLSEGLPLTMMAGFLLLAFVMPSMADFFLRSFTMAFSKLENLLVQIGARRL
ncbi:MAG: flagellar biosynthetic protein FliR [Bacteroides sp.]|nr:flagellar biosynthetic protein FliR [Prevotella sp.]MCM1407332.1 flagellar biosynthetic protein FliR [Treponema brennaborense]MCM1469822.1 flagellar biosynthetic protein FliR [Bacteroides sp.]